MSTKQDLSFEIFVSKFERSKGRHFYCRHMAPLSLATPLRYWEMIIKFVINVYHMQYVFFVLVKDEDMQEILT